MTDNNDFSSKNEDTFYDDKEENIEENKLEEERERVRKEKKEELGKEIFELLKEGTNKETFLLKTKGRRLFRSLKKGNTEKFKKLIKKNGFTILTYKPNNGNKTIFTIAEEMGFKKEIMEAIRENTNSLKVKHEKIEKEYEEIDAKANQLFNEGHCIGGLIKSTKSLKKLAEKAVLETFMDINEELEKNIENYKTTNQEIGR